MELRLIDYNYAQLASTVLTASSEDPAFPATNVKNPIRSRVLRTSGYFVITAANNKLDFSETAGGGSPLVATLSVGVYTPEELEEEIKDKLEVAGANTYTVLYSTADGLWSISSTGTLCLLWLTGANAANSVGSTLGYDTSANVIDVATATAANIAIHTEEYLQFDLQTAEDIDSVALLFDLVRGNKLTSNAVVTLEASATANWTAPALSQVLTIDDTYSVATHFFDAPRSYRYWRIKIVDPANPYLYIEFSKVVLGLGVQLLTLPGRGFKEVKRDTSETQETRYGHRYADIYPLRRTLDIVYPGLRLTDTEKLEAAYKRNGRVTPITLAIDPTEAAFDKDKFFIYGYMGEALQIAQVSGPNFTVPITVEEAV